VLTPPPRTRAASPAARAVAGRTREELLALPDLWYLTYSRLTKDSSSIRRANALTSTAG